MKDPWASTCVAAALQQRAGLVDFDAAAGRDAGRALLALRGLQHQNQTTQSLKPNLLLTHRAPEPLWSLCGIPLHPLGTRRYRVLMY